jgi:hypothetical protein
LKASNKNSTTYCNHPQLPSEFTDLIPLLFLLNGENK